MRTDAIIDRRQIKYLPKSSHLGYDKYKAQCGNVIQWRYPEDAAEHLGRIIGRVHYAPACGETPEIHDWLLVLEIGFGHAFERWVNPEWVTRCQDVKGWAEFLGYMFGPEVPTAENGRYTAEYGALTVDHVGDRWKHGPGEDGTLAGHVRAVLTRRDQQLAGTWKAGA